MQDTPLPNELLALIHHVELNKSGWWQRALQQIILTVMWSYDQNLTIEALTDQTNIMFSTNISNENVQNQVDILLKTDEIVILPTGQMRITEQTRSRIDYESHAGTEREKEIKDLFCKVLNAHISSIDAEECWERFNTACLVPLVRSSGARMYEFLSGADTEIGEKLKFPEFFDEYPEDMRDRLRRAIVQFLDPKEKIVRTFVLSLLNAYFFVEATGLSGEAITKLSDISSSNPSFTIFVDTNFLFSLLNLHDNPANQAARSLRKVIKSLPGNVKAKLYVLPPTIDEFKRVIVAKREQLRDVILTPNIASAAGSAPLDGISSRYIEAAKSGQIGSDQYFGPYLDDTNAILRGNSN